MIFVAFSNPHDFLSLQLVSNQGARPSAPEYLSRADRRLPEGGGLNQSVSLAAEIGNIEQVKCLRHEL
jgi:hypothetical protein